MLLVELSELESEYESLEDPVFISIELEGTMFLFVSRHRRFCYTFNNMYSFSTWG